MLTFSLFSAVSLFALAQGGLFNPAKCSEGYQDISSVLLRFDRIQGARSSHYPYTRGPQMRCIGDYCVRSMHAAVCFAKQVPKRPEEAYDFDCQPIGLPSGFDLTSYEIDCEGELPSSIHEYSLCAYKESCILNYELTPTDLAAKSNAILLSFLFIFALLTTLTTYFCVRFLNRFFPRNSYRRPPPYDPFEHFHAHYKHGVTLDPKRVTPLC
ncbi:uncharacterized protein LOC100906149 [Galendromus occidentalis]|uniref:Uncharacterized protein LOC100906149 n=1 Tax=Galendromus occidentalis TaxID=34638 RepID=A0AAJ6QPD3_9ACAR|nr:uncharacterized protein LOC100906149 [Galendromus occidentalis]